MSAKSKLLVALCSAIVPIVLFGCGGPPDLSSDPDQFKAKLEEAGKEADRAKELIKPTSKKR